MQTSASRSLRLPARGLRQATAARYASTKAIQDVLAELVPQRQEYAKKIKSELGDKVIGDIKVEHVFGGMRGLKVMLWDPSVLDANEGIRFWGRTIPECQEVLPPAPGGKQMLPESMLWYLLTGKVPTAEESRQFTLDLAQRSELSEDIKKIIDSFPKTLHPMTQFVAATAALNQNSAFAKGYETGMAKADYWKPTLEDSLDLCAKVFPIAARIFNNVYRDGAQAPALDKSKDLCYNFAHGIGYDNESFIEVLRLYNSLHTDHEGGNVSAHTSHLVGSALSDPFLSYSAALAGLAGPLHGLANQEVLSFILGMIKEVGPDASDEQIVDHLWALLKSKRVVPGYGHAVLRKPDPRFLALQQFGANDAGISQDPVFKLVNKLYKLAPGVLTEHGKTKNPFPNVDAGSGSLLYHYGLTQQKFYTVLFGTSRALGCVAQLVWSRALGLPIERPKSMSMEALEAFAKKQ